jgi:hypothetical protein
MPQKATTTPTTTVLPSGGSEGAPASVPMYDDLLDKHATQLVKFLEWCEDFEIKHNELSVRVRSLEQQLEKLNSDFAKAILQARRKGYVTGMGDGSVGR